MRNLNKSAGITSKAAKENLQLSVLEMDVDDDKSVKETIDKIIDDKGRIDVIVNNAGYALVGVFEESNMQDGRAQMETNFFGTVRVIKAVLPIMRNQRRGTIVNVTSMGGKLQSPLTHFIMLQNLQLKDFLNHCNMRQGHLELELY